MFKVKTPHLCPICKKEIRERKNCFSPIYCCKKHWIQDPNSSYHRKGVRDEQQVQLQDQCD